MRAKELVPILAEIYGVPFETAFMIDRSLFESGLRTKGRGRTLPEMTRREAIIFLIACMVTQKATKAGNEVQEWLKADGWIDDQDPEAIDQFEDDEDSAPVYVQNIYMKNAVELLPSYTTPNDEDFGRINLVDFLMAVCAMLQANHLTGEEFKFEISVSHGWAAVSINQRQSGGYSELRFQTQKGGQNPVSYETQINKSAVVYGDALLALAARTADQKVGTV